MDVVCRDAACVSYLVVTRISGLVVEYIVAIDVTRVRFPVDTYYESLQMLCSDIQ